MTENKTEIMLNFFFTSSEDPTIKKNYVFRRRRLWMKHFQGIKYSNKDEYNNQLKELIQKNPSLVDEWFEKNKKPKITTPEEHRKRNNEAAKRYQKKNKKKEIPLIEKMKALNLDSNVEPTPAPPPADDSTPPVEPPLKKSIIGAIFKDDLVKSERTTKQYLSNLNSLKNKSNKGLTALKVEHFDIRLFVGAEQLIDKTIEKHFEAKNRQPYYTALCKLFNNYIDQTKSKDQIILKTFHHFCERSVFYANRIDAEKAKEAIKTVAFRPKSEMDNYVPYQQLFSMYLKHKDKLTPYENLLISLYLKTKPMRHDIVKLILVNEPPKLETKGNFLYKNDKGNYRFYYKDTKTSSKYKTLNFPLLNNSLKTLINKHIEVNKIKNGDFLFPLNIRNKNTDIFCKGMEKLTGKKKLNQSLYRKIYVTHLFDEMYRTPEEINKDAYMLGHSVDTEVKTYYIRTK